MATESRSLVVLALIANATIAVVKFIAAAVSGSSAMLAEGFHSVADTGNQLFLLRERGELMVSTIEVHHLERALEFRGSHRLAEENLIVVVGWTLS